MKLFSIIAIVILVPVSFVMPQQKGEDKVLLFQKSVQFETAKNYPKALQSILEYREANPSDYLANLRLGWLYYLSNDHETSIRYYMEAMRLSDNSIESMLGITLPYSELKKWDNIQEIYKNIIGKDRNHYLGNLRLGQIYYNSGKYILAKKYFDTVIENYPSDYEANLYMGWTYYFLGSKSKALYYFTNAVVLNSSDTSAKEGLELTK